MVPCLWLMPVLTHLLAIFIQHLLYARFWECCSEHIKQGAACLHGHVTDNLKVLRDIHQKRYRRENCIDYSNEKHRLLWGQIVRGSPEDGWCAGSFSLSLSSFFPTLSTFPRRLACMDSLKGLLCSLLGTCHWDSGRRMRLGYLFPLFRLYPICLLSCDPLQKAINSWK